MDIVNDDETPKVRVKKDFEYYRSILSFLGSNVPIQVLCLPKTIENILIRDGFDRVYDLISRDLTEIKGLGAGRLSLLTSRLDEFFSVSI